MNKGYVIEKIREYLTDCEVVYRDVTKNNGLVRTGIQITKNDSLISPVIYINEDDADDVIVDKVLEIYTKDINNPNIDINAEELIEMLPNWDKVKGKIYPKLYNSEKTKDDDIITIPFVNDISTMFYIEIKDGMTTKVKRDLFDKWNVTIDDVLKVAKENLNKRLVIGDIMNFLVFGGMSKSDRSVEVDDALMLVSTTINTINGASTALLIPDLIANGEIPAADYWFIPSSIHEVLILKDYSEAIKGMIKEVNSTQVAPDEILSDYPFKYNNSNGAFETV